MAVDRFAVFTFLVILCTGSLANPVVKDEPEAPVHLVKPKADMSPVVQDEQEAPVLLAEHQVYMSPVVQDEQEAPVLLAEHQVYMSPVVQDEQEAPVLLAEHQVYMSPVVQDEQEAPVLLAEHQVDMSPVVQDEQEAPVLLAEHQVDVSPVVRDEQENAALLAEPRVDVSPVVQDDQEAAVLLAAPLVDMSPVVKDVQEDAAFLAEAQVDLLPPMWKPGDTMTKTDYESVDTALSDVVRAGGVFQGRRCAIGVANIGDTELSAPKWFVESGLIHSAAPYSIKPHQTGLTLFHKRDVHIFGTTGVLSYDIGQTHYKVAILWQVPWNTVAFDVLFNVKIYHKDAPTDRIMFYQMINRAGIQKSSGWLERNEFGIKALATITDNTFAKYYISVDAREYSPEAGPELNTGCDWNLANPLWVGRHCWQECSPTGYCWVNKRCNTAADCQGPLSCHDKCRWDDVAMK